MQNLELIGNSLVGGNVVTILARTLIRMRAAAAAAAFRAQAFSLQQQSMDIQYILPTPDIAGVPISVKKQESYSFRSDITRHAVESGANLTDHVILQPVQVNVSFEVTNWDLAKPQQAYDLLTKMWQDRVLLDLVTMHSVIPNMVMTNLDMDNSVPNWGALECRATFFQVNFVTLESVKFDDDKVTPTASTGGPDNSKSATSSKNTGKQQAQDMPPGL